MLRVKNSVLKVLIADDHAIVRKGLKEILRESSVDTVVGEASNGSEALDLAERDAWDVIVLDITMPPPNGLEVLRRLQRDQPDVPVLMLSMHSGRAYIDSSIKAGAAGYLSKEAAPDELIEAISTVLDGGKYISRDLRNAV
jgi:two-component system, NarL family, invasion response regulator UvrY